MTLHEITQKLIGPVQPVGESHTDPQREKNLGEMIELVDRLMFDITEAAASKDRPEASMASIGKRAQQYIDDLRDSLS